jgi:hypothetical protein
MDLIYNSKDIHIHNIEVDEEIDKKSLKDFLLSNLGLQKITLNKNQKIIITYIKELKIYQLLIFDKSIKYADFQVFEKLEYIKDDTFSFIIFQDFLYIFKNQEFYYIQNLQKDLNKDDFINFLKYRFSLDDILLRNISFEEFEKLKKEYLKEKRKTTLKFFNYKQDFSFYIYIFYLFLLILCLVFYFLYFKDEKINEKPINYEEIKQNYQFKSINKEFYTLLFTMQELNIKLEELKYLDNSLKITISSKNKDSILNFLKSKDFVFLNSEIKSYDENLFKAQADVKISE